MQHRINHLCNTVVLFKIRSGSRLCQYKAWDAAGGSRPPTNKANGDRSEKDKHCQSKGFPRLLKKFNGFE
jgi:hypothetical protein